MWFLLVVIFYINPQTGPEVKHVHISKTFDTQGECLKYMNSTRSDEIPPLHHLGCIKWGDKVV